MSVKYFDLNRLAKFSTEYDYVYLTPEDIVGLSMQGDHVYRIYTMGGPVTMNPLPIGEFTEEIERAVKQTMNDQNEVLLDLKKTIADKVQAARDEAALTTNTDKIADYN